jgi:hypothetical protein
LSKMLPSQKYCGLCLESTSGLFLSCNAMKFRSLLPFIPSYLLKIGLSESNVM